MSPMTLIRRTNPFGELVSLQRVMDRLLDDSRIGPRTAALTAEHSPAVDVPGTPETIEIEAARPGVVTVSAAGSAAAATSEQ